MVRRHGRPVIRLLCLLGLSENALSEQIYQIRLLVNALLVVNVFAFLVFCSFRGTANVLGFVLFLFTANVWFFVGFFNYLSEKIFRFGYAVLLLVSLKRNSTRIARVVLPFFYSALGYMEQTNKTKTTNFLFAFPSII